MARSLLGYARTLLPKVAPEVLVRRAWIGDSESAIPTRHEPPPQGSRREAQGEGRRASPGRRRNPGETRAGPRPRTGGSSRRGDRTPRGGRIAFRARLVARNRAEDRKGTNAKRTKLRLVLGDELEGTRATHDRIIFAPWTGANRCDCVLVESPVPSGTARLVPGVRREKHRMDGDPEALRQLQGAIELRQVVVGAA